MRRSALEQSPDWLATVEYDGSRGRQVLCLLRDRFTPGGFFWLIPDCPGAWPWEVVRDFVATGLATAGEPEGDLAEMRRLGTDEAVLAMMPRVAPV
jgi:hypothetical protein